MPFLKIKLFNPIGLPLLLFKNKDTFLLYNCWVQTYTFECLDFKSFLLFINEFIENLVQKSSSKNPIMPSQENFSSFIAFISSNNQFH